MGSQTFRLTVTLIHGDPIVVEVDRTQYDVMNSGSRIETALDRPHFGVRLDGRLVFVPSSNIARIEIDPAPDVLVKGVITDARPAG